MQVSQTELAKNSVDVLEMASELLSSNVTNIGRGTSYADNVLATLPQLSDPLFTWLMNTPVSNMLANALSNGSIQLYKGTDGKWYLKAPLNVGTLPATDTGDNCCFLPFDLSACQETAPLSLLCVKDCLDIMDSFIENKLKVQPNDLINYFKKSGQTYKEVRRNMNILSLQFYIMQNVLWGQKGVRTPTTKDFQGLLDIMKSPKVLKLYGGNVISALNQIVCRLSYLDNTSNFVIAVSPAVYETIKEAFQPNEFGRLPVGVTLNGETLIYKGLRFVVSKYVPVDIESGKGSMYVLDGNVLGAFLGDSITNKSEEFIKQNQDLNDNPSNGCGEICDYFYNYGTTVVTNYNHLAVIEDVKISSACNPVSLANIGQLVIPETIAPLV